MVEQFYVNIGDPTWSCFLDIVLVQINREEDRQTPLKTLTPRLLLAWVIDFSCLPPS